MAGELFANVPATTVSSGGTDAPASGTPETWTVASSTPFPAASSSLGTQFHVGDPAADTEIILVTNVSGTTWTVTRGAEGSTPVTHSAGFTIVQVIPKGFLDFTRLHVTDWLNVTGSPYFADPTGAVLGVWSPPAKVLKKPAAKKPAAKAKAKAPARKK